jgi:hypothetical protein
MNYREARSEGEIEAGTLLDEIDSLRAEVEALKRPLTDDVIRALFLANGFEIKLGHTDLKPYVYAAARAVEAAHLEAAKAARRNV